MSAAEDLAYWERMTRSAIQAGTYVGHAAAVTFLAEIDRLRAALASEARAKADAMVTADTWKLRHDALHMDRPTYRHTGERRSGEVADPAADLARYDELLASTSEDYPGRPLMERHRAELAERVQCGGAVWGHWEDPPERCGHEAGHPGECAP